MKAHEFKLLKRILKERSGVDLREEKADLVEAKLRPLLTELAFPSLTHLTLALTKPDSERLASRVAQTIAVLETYFFRDKAPFRYFAEVMLPRLMERREASRQIRIWCAASSTGQEPYSIAMLLCDEARATEGWTIDLVATDFSESALRKAKAGLYTQFEVQRGLPVSYLVKYFNKAGSGWQIKPEVRDRVVFGEYNLLSDPRAAGQFDVIFCRNVLIYFDEPLRRAVLSRLAGQLSADGYLVLGSAETTRGFSDAFVPVSDGYHGIFRFTPEAAAARRQACLQRGARGAERAADPGAWTAFLEQQQGALAASGEADYRDVRLDRATADLLELRARARGLTVPELLSRYAAVDPFAVQPVSPKLGELPKEKRPGRARPLV